jgi:methylated-DNA-[protein]-cysteine S-methyltransferase
MAQRSVDIKEPAKHFQAIMDSPLGKLALESDGYSILSVHIKSLNEPAGDLFPGSGNMEVPDCLNDCQKQLREYFDGLRQQFDLPLSPAGTSFQQKVWTALQQIPFGQTISYLELARRLGDPKVIRAAGTANGKNPIAIVIPCHRVIGSNGDLVGYAGGLENKKWLLDHEQKCTGRATQLSIF